MTAVSAFENAGRTGTTSARAGSGFRGGRGVALQREHLRRVGPSNCRGLSFWETVPCRKNVSAPGSATNWRFKSARRWISWHSTRQGIRVFPFKSTQPSVRMRPRVVERKGIADARMLMNKPTGKLWIELLQGREAHLYKRTPLSQGSKPFFQRHLPACKYQISRRLFYWLGFL